MVAMAARIENENFSNRAHFIKKKRKKGFKHIIMDPNFCEK